MAKGFRAIFAYVAILLALGVMLGFLTYHVEHSPANNVDIITDSTRVNASESDYYIPMQSRVGNGWWVVFDKSDPYNISHGICYDAEVINNTKNNVTDWSVSFELPENGFISELWNADWKVEDGVVIVSPMDYSKVIEAGTKETFGFVLYTPRPVGEFTKFNFKATRIRDVRDEALYWILILAMFTVVVVMVTNMVAAIRYRHIREKYHTWRSLTEQSMRTVANTIDAKDEYTSGHSYRVAVISRMLAQKAGMSRAEQENIYYMGLLHDIGKIGISDSTLNKKGKLNDEEWEQIKKHPAMGGDILKDITTIPDIECGARYHHERWDGKGYGEGKKGEEIPLVARIICVADAYDAMSTARCYREKYEDSRIVEELRNCSGTQFDPSLVPYMIELIENHEIHFDSSDAEGRNHPKLTEGIETEDRGKTSAFLALVFALLSFIPIYGVFFSIFAVIFGFVAISRGKKLQGIISLGGTAAGVLLTACLLIFKDGLLQQVLEAISTIF